MHKIMQNECKGRTCGEMEECFNCGIDQSIPCSPDCPELNEDGTIDNKNEACIHCDANEDRVVI